MPKSHMPGIGGIQSKKHSRPITRVAQDSTAGVVVGSTGRIPPTASVVISIAATQANVMVVNRFTVDDLYCFPARRGHSSGLRNVGIGVALAPHMEHLSSSMGRMSLEFGCFTKHLNTVGRRQYRHHRWPSGMGAQIFLPETLRTGGLKPWGLQCIVMSQYSGSLSLTTPKALEYSGRSFWYQRPPFSFCTINRQGGVW